MKPALTVFGYILIGAAAAGIGTGFFLIEANQDRAMLVQQKQDAERQAAELLAASNRLAEEANQKIQEAGDEVMKTRERLRKLEEEQAMIRRAAPLARSSRTQYWEEILHLPLGFTVRVPRTAVEISHVTSSLVVGKQGGAEPWTELRAWDEKSEADFGVRLQNTEELYYLVSGQLVAGKKGSASDGEEGYLFRVQSGGTSTLLIWAKESTGFGEREIIDMISSLTFRS
jgi:hypothetical protein